MELVPQGEDGDEMEHADKAHEETIEVSLPQSAPLLLLRITSLPLRRLLPRPLFFSSYSFPRLSASGPGFIHTFTLIGKVLFVYRFIVFAFASY